MNPEKVVVSAEDDSCVIYAEIGGIILGIRLDPVDAVRIGDDLLDRARIIMRHIEHRQFSQPPYPATQANERKGGES